MFEKKMKSMSVVMMPKMAEFVQKHIVPEYLRKM
jgi:hypothetical protein